jgi:F0F1-type ATP synthase membrane subunit b/b'
MKTRRILALAAAGVVLAAGPALAADDLSIFPDLIEDALYGTHGGEIVANPLRSTFVRLVILFAAIIVPLNLLMFRPLLRALEQRGEKIEGARARASAVSKQAGEVLGRYEAAVGAARSQAETVRRQALESARVEQARIGAAARAAAEAEIAEARVGVAGALEAARVALRGETQRLAQEAAAKVLGRPLA